MPRVRTSWRRGRQHRHSETQAARRRPRKTRPGDEERDPGRPKQARQGPHEALEPAAWDNQVEDEAREPVQRSTSAGAGLASALEQEPIADTRRTDGLAGAAAEALVDVQDKRRIGRSEPALGDRMHQVDTPAG